MLHFFNFFPSKGKIDGGTIPHWCSCICTECTSLFLQLQAITACCFLAHTPTVLQDHIQVVPSGYSHSPAPLHLLGCLLYSFPLYFTGSWTYIKVVTAKDLLLCCLPVGQWAIPVSWGMHVGILAIFFPQMNFNRFSHLLLNRMAGLPTVVNIY